MGKQHFIAVGPIQVLGVVLFAVRGGPVLYLTAVLLDREGLAFAGGSSLYLIDNTLMHSLALQKAAFPFVGRSAPAVL